MKTAYILVGAKGSGKSYIGNLLFKKLGIYFIRVEDLFLSLKTTDPLNDEKYIDSGYQLVEQEVVRFLTIYDSVVFESTGISRKFDNMVCRLKDRFNVKIIRVEARDEKCLDRIKRRDQSVHIPVSDDSIRRINELSGIQKREYDLVIENDDSSDEEILCRFKANLNS